MARKSTIRLLLINESDNESERLVSQFRNAGRVARAHRASSADELHTILKKETWDLLIANDKHPELNPEHCLEQIQKLKLDIPVIVVREGAPVSALFQAGAKDVVATNDDPRLIFAAQREIDNLDARRKQVSLLEQLREAEQRNTQLMSDAQDAIAFVADGMVISANGLFAERFGYAAAEDMDCLPIIDLISANDQEKFKTILKNQATSTTPSELDFTGRTPDDKEFAACVQLCASKYEGEPCVQLVVREQGSTSGAAGDSDKDSITGLYSQSYFLKQTANAAKQAGMGSGQHCVALIGVDNFGAVQEKFGLAGSQLFLKNLGEFMQKKIKNAGRLAHYCDGYFALLLSDASGDKAQDFARTLGKKIEEAAIEIGAQSTLCTVTIGLRVIDKECRDEPQTIVEQAFGCCQQVREAAKKGGIGNGVAIYTPLKEKRSLSSAGSDAAIEEALEDQRFFLMYQPIISLRGAVGDHYEVQLRMLDDNGDEVTPDDFLVALGNSAASNKLDRWIILEATKALAVHRGNGNDTRLLINLTANILTDETLLPWFGVAMKAGGIPAEALTVQFREADIAANIKAAKKFSDDVHALGCKFSITNYGQAAEPEKLLKKIPSDFVKIDGSYSRKLQHNEGDPEAVKNLVAHIRENEVQAIVPFVENAAALASLWQLGVDFIQGEYLQGPQRDMSYEFTDIA